MFLAEIYPMNSFSWKKYNVNKWNDKILVLS